MRLFYAFKNTSEKGSVDSISCKRGPRDKKSLGIPGLKRLSGF